MAHLTSTGRTLQLFPLFRFGWNSVAFKLARVIGRDSNLGCSETETALAVKMGSQQNQGTVVFGCQIRCRHTVIFSKLPRAGWFLASDTRKTGVVSVYKNQLNISKYTSPMDLGYSFIWVNGEVRRVH